MPDPTVLILGCGIGGVVAANECRRLLPAPWRVVVVDQDARASFPPSYSLGDDGGAAAGGDHAPT